MADVAVLELADIDSSCLHFLIVFVSGVFGHFFDFAECDLMFRLGQRFTGGDLFVELEHSFSGREGGDSFCVIALMARFCWAVAGFGCPVPIGTSS